MAGQAKADAKAKQRLQDRPGWSSLLAAGRSLHAAELLIGDPIGDPNLAHAHVRSFWSLALEAARAAGQTQASELAAWLAGELPGLSPRRRARCAATYSRWVAVEPAPALARGALRAHAADARALLRALEPEVGGRPFLRRRWQIVATLVTLALIFGPALVYQKLTEVIPGEGPWRGAYFADKEFGGEPVYRRDLDVHFDFGNRGPMDEIPPDKFSIRWDTCLVLDEPTAAIFQLKSNDGGRFYVDGELIIDAWDRKTHGFGSGSLEIGAGVHHLRVEMFESLSGASAVLVGSLDGEVPKPLPHQILRYPGDEFDEADPCAAAR